jgi:guanylate kinase
MAGILFIISAPSGSGKSTLVNRIKQVVPNLKFSISYTTRAPRGSEQSDVEYHFVSRERFEQMVNADEFLEWATVFDNYYGTAHHYLSDAKFEGKDLLLDIDVQGAAQLRKRVPNAVSIFILPPDRVTLEQRLRRRSQAEHVTDQQIIRRRLEKAREEIGRYPDYGYILVNDKLDDAEAELEAIVWTERMKRNSPDAADIPPEQAEHYRQLAAACEQGNNQRIYPVLESFGLAGSTMVG